MLRAVAVPPPPSSVVTKVLPWLSTAPSYIPPLSISSMVMEYGALKARMAATQVASWVLSSRM